MKILLIGGTGRIGTALKNLLREHTIKLYTPSSKDLNVANYPQILNSLSLIKPKLIINTAVVGVDLSETNSLLAKEINHLGSENLARACSVFGIPLLHLSTDYVFSGDTNKPYEENDTAYPVNVYGKTKHAGEKSIIQQLEKHIIFRTSWVFGEYGHSFMKTILSLAKKNKTIQVVSDEISCPTYVDDIANALLVIAKQIHDDEALWGIYHFCGDEAISRYEYALKVVNAASKDARFKLKNIQPILSKDFTAIAQRPKFTAMSCKKINEVFDIKPSPWYEKLSILLKNSSHLYL